MNVQSVRDIRKENMELIFKIVITIILLFLAIVDLKKKEIPVWMVGILFFTVVTGKILLGSNLFLTLTGFSVGAVIFAIAILSKEKIGIGDGLVAICLGIFLGGKSVIKTMLIASIIMTLVSVFLLISKKGKMDTTLPFLPAILIGFICV